MKTLQVGGQPAKVGRLVVTSPAKILAYREDRLRVTFDAQKS